MKPKSVDVTPAVVRKNAVAIREAGTVKEATKLLLSFCEYYRKNYTTRKHRLSYVSGKNAEATRKWFEANRETFNEKRRNAYREKAEEAWRNGERSKKPRWL